MSTKPTLILLDYNLLNSTNEAAAIKTRLKSTYEFKNGFCARMKLFGANGRNRLQQERSWNKDLQADFVMLFS